MKKTFILLSLILVLSSCESNLDEKFDEAKESANEENKEFIEAYGNSSPEEAVNGKYDELVTQYGEPDAYFTLYTGNDPSWEQSFYISEQLGLDYEKLAYIQQQSGTYGLQSVLQAMKSDEKVDAVLKVFLDYHDATDGDISYFKKTMPKNLTAQEEAEFIAQEIVKVYLPFFKIENVSTWNQTFVDKYAEISGLNKENLEAIDTWWSLDFYTELLPDELEYKVELEALILNRYEL